MRKLTRNDINLLLYFETCLVDFNGKVNPYRMNKRDFESAKDMHEGGLIIYQRMPGDYLLDSTTNPTLRTSHYVQFSPEALRITHGERAARINRGQAKLKKLLEKYNCELQTFEEEE